MIVYQATKRQFVHDTFQDDIEHVLSQQYLRSTGRQPSAVTCYWSCSDREEQPLEDIAEGWITLLELWPRWRANRRTSASSTTHSAYFALTPAPRKGKIVVSQQRRICAPESGGRYTIKRYRSEILVGEDGKGGSIGAS